MNSFEQKCAELAISEAEKSLSAGNFPVGAVLCIGDEIIASSGNCGETTKNYTNHAEVRLMLENGSSILQAAKDGKKITLLSTLEPCLMCLGMAVLNKVDRIIFLQKEPLSGASNLDNKSLAIRYQKKWPEIIYMPYSEKPKKLVIDFLNKQIENGIRVDWSKDFLRILNETEDYMGASKS